MAGRETTELKIVYASCLQGVVLPSFWNYFYDKKKLFSRTQYAKREAVDGGKGRKCLMKDISLYKKWLCFKKKTYLCPSDIVQNKIAK